MVILRFEFCTLCFHITAEYIRGLRIDFSKFGKFMSGEGPDWELVMCGYVSVKESPNGSVAKR